MAREETGKPTWRLGVSPRGRGSGKAAPASPGGERTQVCPRDSSHSEDGKVILKNKAGRQTWGHGTDKHGPRFSGVDGEVVLKVWGSPEWHSLGETGGTAVRMETERNPRKSGDT